MNQTKNDIITYLNNLLDEIIKYYQKNQSTCGKMDKAVSPLISD